MAHPHDPMPQASALPGDATWLTEWQRKAADSWFKEDTDAP